MSPEERLEPWTVRDALILLDKKTASLTDHFHETQALVQSFRVSVENLEQRINNGLSPTMQKIKDQNVEIEKSIIRLDGRFETIAQELRSAVGLVAGNVTELKDDRDAMKKAAWGVITKVSAAAIISIASMFFAMWTMLGKMQDRFDQEKAQVLMWKTTDLKAKTNAR